MRKRRLIPFLVVGLTCLLALLFLLALREPADSVVRQVSPEQLDRRDQDFEASSPPTSIVESAENAPEEDVFEAFEDWLSSYRGGNRLDSFVAEGARHAKARQAKLYQLFQDNPKLALEKLLSLDEYAALPEALLGYMETPRSGLGDVDLRWSTHINEDETQLSCSSHNRLYLEGESFRASGIGRRDTQLPIIGAPVFAYTIDDRALVLESPSYALSERELEVVDQFFTRSEIAIDPLTEREVDLGVSTVIGGVVHSFSDQGSLEEVERMLIEAEESAQDDLTWSPEYVTGWLAGDIGGHTPTITQSSFFDDDDITVLFIRLDFSDFTGEPVSKANLETDLATISSHLNTMSYGQASLTYTVTTTLYRPSQTGTSYAQSLGNDALHTDALAAYDAAPDALPSSSYDVVAIYFPDLDGVSGSTITYGGLASVGGSRMWINGLTTSNGRVQVITHEFGHNYGLFHSNYWHPGREELGGDYFDSPTFGSLEYGDIFDLMGDGDLPEAHFNHFQKNNIDWIPDSKVATATGDATYRIYRFDHVDATDNPLLALRVPMGGDVNWWVGHRQLFDSNPNMEIGAYVVAEGLYTGRSNLIDMTPESTPDESSDRFDAALPVGQSLVDTAGGVTFTTVASGTNGAGDEWIDVQLDFEPRVGFSADYYESEESSGIAVLTLERDFDSSGALTVDFSTSDNSATSDADFYAASGTVSWGAGDASDKTITIHLRPDSVGETGEDFTVTLSNPSSGVLQQGRTTATVRVLDPGERYDSFAPDFFNNRVSAIDFQSDGRAIIAGRIDHSTDSFVGAGNIARLGNDGSVDVNFNAGGAGFNDDVSAMVVLPDDRIVVAGEFGTYNGVSVPGLVLLSADGVLDGSFNTAVGTGPDADIFCLAVDVDGKILAGGEFANFNGTSAAGLIRLNTDGTSDTPLTLPFNGGFSSRVRAIEVLSDGDMMVTGTFYVGWTGSGFRSGLLRLNSDGSRDVAFDPDGGLHASSGTSSLASGYSLALLPDGDVLVGGQFDEYDENVASRFARVGNTGNFIGASPVAFNSLTVSAILSEPFGGFLVGDWNDAGAGAELIRISENGAEDPSFTVNFTSASTTSGTVNVLKHAPDGSLWVGGNFFSYNGSSSRPVVRLASGVSPYDFWAAENFSGAQIASGDADPESDPDGDGITNIAEMALGTGPTSFESGSNLMGGLVSGLVLQEIGMNQYLELSLDKSAMDGGVWFGVQLSSDLLSWSPDPATPEDDSAFEILEDSASRMVIRDRTPVSSSNPRFVRVVFKAPE